MKWVGTNKVLSHNETSPKRRLTYDTILRRPFMFSSKGTLRSFQAISTSRKQLRTHCPKLRPWQTRQWKEEIFQRPADYEWLVKSPCYSRISKRKQRQRHHRTPRAPNKKSFDMCRTFVRLLLVPRKLWQSICWIVREFLLSSACSKLPWDLRLNLQLPSIF